VEVPSARFDRDNRAWVPIDVDWLPARNVWPVRARYELAVNWQSAKRHRDPVPSELGSSKRMTSLHAHLPAASFCALAAFFGKQFLAQADL
jgi:hypothetical protein